MKEGNVLFNDALNTFYLRLYGVRHMVKYHTDSERGNPLTPLGLLFPINSKGSFICTIPQIGLHLPPPLLHQLYSTGWNEKKLNGSTPWRIDPTTHHIMSECSYHGATSRSDDMKANINQSNQPLLKPWFLRKTFPLQDMTAPACIDSGCSLNQHLNISEIYIYIWAIKVRFNLMDSQNQTKLFQKNNWGVDLF